MEGITNTNFFGVMLVNCRNPIFRTWQWPVILLVHALLASSCTPESGSASRENVIDPLADSKDVVVMPPNARSPFHAQALRIGSSMVSDMAVDLKEFGLSDGQAELVTKSAESSMVAAVQALIINAVELFLSFFKQEKVPEEPISVVIQPLNKGAVGSLGFLSLQETRIILTILGKLWILRLLERAIKRRLKKY